MAPMRWRPLSTRGSVEDTESYDALHDGIPEWLQSSILNWIYNVIKGFSSRGAGDVGLLRTMERELRLALHWQMSREDEVLERGRSAPVIRHITRIVSDDDPRALDVVDYLLGKA